MDGDMASRDPPFGEDADESARPPDSGNAGEEEKRPERGRPDTRPQIHIAPEDLLAAGDNEQNRSISESDKPADATTPQSGARIKHQSGNSPAVRGIIIESRSSRENSPGRSSSPYRSPGISPGYLSGDRTFTLPSVGTGGTQARLPSSSSDYTVYTTGSSDGSTRPKSAPKRDSSATDSAYADRRHSTSEIHVRRRGNRTRMESTGDSVDERSQEVIEQSEEVMLNYMFERHSRDTVHSEGEMTVPRSPTLLEGVTRNARTPASLLGRRLATIGDEIDAKYQTEFKVMSKSLNIRQGAFDDAYDAFRGVAMRLFERGLSMGRIVALLQFGYSLAMDVLRQGVGDFMSNIIGWLVRFISFEKIRSTAGRVTQSIAEWIARQGGWQAAVESMTNVGSTLSDSLPSIVAFAGACTILVSAVIWLNRS